MIIQEQPKDVVKRLNADLVQIAIHMDERFESQAAVIQEQGAQIQELLAQQNADRERIKNLEKDSKASNTALKVSICVVGALGLLVVAPPVVAGTAIFGAAGTAIIGAAGYLTHTWQNRKR